MAIRHTNLERRGRQFYYRASFTLDGKHFAVRLSLRTDDPRTAHERAVWMDRLLKDRWQRMTTTQDQISEADMRSILREAALNARDAFDSVHVEEQVVGYDDAEEATRERLRTIRCMEVVARDVFAHGIGPAFGSDNHFRSRFVEGMPLLAPEDQVRIEEILDQTAGLATGINDGAEKALRRRNLPVMPINIARVRRQMMLGVIAGLREIEQAVSNPDIEINDLLGAISLSSNAMNGNATASSIPTSAIANTLATSPAESETPLPASSPIVTPSQSAAEPVPIMTGAAAAKAYLAANPKLDAGETSRWTPKTRSQFEAAVFLAGKFFGPGVDIRSIGEEQIADFFRALRRLPSNHHKTPAHSGMTLEAIAQANPGAGLSLVTTNRHMRFLRLVFDWVARRTQNPPIIDWKAYVEADSRVKKDKRPAFTVTEMEALLRGAVWTGCESRTRRLKPGPHIWQDAAYWVPILLAYTGARREEVAKAMVADIEQIDDIWALRIRNTETGRVKNASAERDVPLADALIELGFLDFVERQRLAGCTGLFPELQTGGANYGDAFYKKWWRGFMRAGLVPAGKDMHSIRHYVATELAACDVSEERRADLLGHTMDTSETSRTYTKRTRLHTLLEVVNKLPNVTEHLRAPGSR